jgi:hypothetical protein
MTNRDLVLGVKIRGPEDAQWVVSLTQWSSLDAHQRFLESAEAGPFFQALTSLTAGPPTVAHYNFGRTDFQRKFTHTEFVFMKSAQVGGEDNVIAQVLESQRVEEPQVAASCVEDSCVVSTARWMAGVESAQPFPCESVSNLGITEIRRFQVQWRSFEQSVIRASI